MKKRSKTTLHQRLADFTQICKKYLFKLVTIRIITFPQMPFQHPIYYSQFTRYGNLIGIWSDIALAFTLSLGLLGSVFSSGSLKNNISLLFGIRAYIMGEIHLYEVASFLNKETDTAEVLITRNSI